MQAVILMVNDTRLATTRMVRGFSVVIVSRDRLDRVSWKAQAQPPATMIHIPTNWKKGEAILFLGGCKMK